MLDQLGGYHLEERGQVTMKVRVILCLLLSSIQIPTVLNLKDVSSFTSYNHGQTFLSQLPTNVHTIWRKITVFKKNTNVLLEDVIFELF